jgi:hypothetical protein
MVETAGTVTRGTSSSLLAACRAICEHWSTQERTGHTEGSGRLVGDGTWLTLGEALERLKAAPKPIPIS